MKPEKKRTCVIGGRLRVESRILRRWYKDFNRNFFHGKLPKNVFLFWDDKMYDDAYGRFYTAEDTGSGFAAISVNAYLRLKNCFGGTLLHEMIHVKFLGHGRRFQAERKRLLTYEEVRDIVL